MAGEERTSSDKNHASAIIPADYNKNEYSCIQISSSTRGKGRVIVPRKGEAPTSVKIAALSNMYVVYQKRICINACDDDSMCCIIFLQRHRAWGAAR